MQYPLKNPQVVKGGQFGSDPATYKQFGLIGHHGVDLVAPLGTPVYAPEDAFVYKSANGTTDQYTGAAVSGQVIVLKGTYEYWLLHLSIRSVSVGDKVKAGQLVGYSGATGFVTGPHLHWGVRPLNPDLSNGYRGFVNPITVMEEQMLTPTDIDMVFKMAGALPTKADLQNPQYARDPSLLIQTVWNNIALPKQQATQAKANVSKQDVLDYINKNLS